jgi:hypothetical protein
MDVFEAPDPDDIFWPNCGRPNDDLQVRHIIGKYDILTLKRVLSDFFLPFSQFGMLMSIMFTLGLLLIW